MLNLKVFFNFLPGPISALVLFSVLFSTPNNFILSLSLNLRAYFFFKESIFGQHFGQSLVNRYGTYMINTKNTSFNFFYCFCFIYRIHFILVRVDIKAFFFSNFPLLIDYASTKPTTEDQYTQEKLLGNRFAIH